MQDTTEADSFYTDDDQIFNHVIEMADRKIEEQERKKLTFFMTASGKRTEFEFNLHEPMFALK